jgi:hypothetical protein
MRQGWPSDKQLDRVERMLERCIEADKAAQRKADPFYHKLKILTESQKRADEAIRALSRPEDDQPKH